MKFIHRVGYYLGGFSIGLIILAFFLQGKKTSCDYGPNSRTTKNIANKTIQYSDQAMDIMNQYQMDTFDVSNLLRYGTVDFSKSDTNAEACKTYYIDNTFKENPFELKVENCDSIAKIHYIKIKQ